MSERIFYRQPDGLIAVWSDVSNSFEWYDATAEEIAADKGGDPEKIWRNVEACDMSTEDFLRAVKMVRVEYGAHSDEYKDVCKWDNERPLEIVEAIKTLNFYGHRGILDWGLNCDDVIGGYAGCNCDAPVRLHAYEAIAIAEKYMREG